MQDNNQDNQRKIYIRNTKQWVPVRHRRLHNHRGRHLADHRLQAWSGRARKRRGKSADAVLRAWRSGTVR